MSLEPPTTASVVFHTSKGPIEVEVWAKEAHEIARAFLSNCANNRYSGQTFARITRDYTVETEALVPATQHRSEFHSRIRFNKRGMLAAVRREGPYSSADAFFITLKPAPEFDNNYVPLGRVVGDTFYNVVKINEGDLQEDETTPVHPVSIIRVEVCVPFFTDLVVRQEETEEPAKQTKKKKKPVVKLSYEDEDEVEQGPFKMRSAHELLHDKRLSKGFVQKKEAGERVEISTKEKMGSGNSVPMNVAEVPGEVKPSTEAAGNGQPAAHNMPPEPRQKLRTRNLRDPTIDSDFDPYLDLSDAENIDEQALGTHRF